MVLYADNIRECVCCEKVAKRANNEANEEIEFVTVAGRIHAAKYHVHGYETGDHEAVSQREGIKLPIRIARPDYKVDFLPYFCNLSVLAPGRDRQIVAFQCAPAGEKGDDKANNGNSEAYSVVVHASPLFWKLWNVKLNAMPYIALLSIVVKMHEGSYGFFCFFD